MLAANVSGLDHIGTLAKLMWQLATFLRLIPPGCPSICNARLKSINLRWCCEEPDCQLVLLFATLVWYGREFTVRTLPFAYRMSPPICLRGY